MDLGVQLAMAKASLEDLKVERAALREVIRPYTPPQIRHQQGGGEQAGLTPPPLVQFILQGVHRGPNPLCGWIDLLREHRSHLPFL